MYLLKGLLSPRSRSEQQTKVNQIFSEARVEGSSTLHPDYLKILNFVLLKAQDESKCLKLLISKLETLSSIEEIVKCFTLVHRLMISKNYKGPILECIENAEIIMSRELKLQEGQKYEGWFRPFYTSYIRYLVKAASNSEIMIRASQQNPTMQPKAYLNDLFRLVNQLNTILVPLNNTTKIVGRYYSKKLKVFEELYNVLQAQLLNVYKYFRILIDAILKNYEQLSVAELQTFIIAIPEYQLMLDQLEDILMCKYFKGGCKYSQPYVWAEDIAKINYYISCRKKPQ